MCRNLVDIELTDLENLIVEDWYLALTYLVNQLKFKLDNENTSAKLSF